MMDTAPPAWRCTVCGYIHRAAQPPDGCPICGAARGTFEPEDASFEVAEQEGEDAYARLVFHDGRMVGAVLLGDTSTASPLKKAIETKADFSGLLRRRAGAADVLASLAAQAG